MAKENLSEQMNITESKVGSNETQLNEKFNDDATNVLKAKYTNNSMEQILKENLSCEMFHFVLNVFYSPHIILKIILAFFILIACSLFEYMNIFHSQIW